MKPLRAALIMSVGLAGGVRAVQAPPPAPSLSQLEAIARADSNDATAHYQLAMAYWDRRKWDQAERELREALLISPSYADAHLALGVLPERRGSGYWQGRIKREGEDSVRTILLDYESHFRRAFLLDPLVDLKVLGKVEKPESGFVQAGGRLFFILPPWYAPELVKSANEFREGRYEKAFDRLQQLVDDKRSGGGDAHAPSDVLWYHGLTAAHLEKRDVAIRDFAILTRRTMDEEQDTTGRGRTGPLHSNDYRFILATMLYLDGQFREAIPTFRRVLEMDLGMYVAHVQLARMQEAYGHFEEALAERRLALDVNQDDPDLLVDLAATLIRAGRVQDAEEPLREAARLNPRDARVPYVRAAVALQRGDSASARAAYTRFVAIAPSRFGPQVAEARTRLASLPSEP